MIMSSLCMSVLSFTVKKGLESFSVIQVTFIRYFVPFVLSLPYFLRSDFFSRIQMTKGISLHLLRSLCSVMAQWSLNYYLTKASLTNGSVLWNTAPIYLPFFMWILQNKKPSMNEIFFLLLSFLGVILVVKPSIGIFDSFSFWGLSAGFLISCSQILWGYNTEKGGVAENLFYLYFFCSFLTLIPLLMDKSSLCFFPLNSSFIWGILILMGVTSIGNQYYRSRAYKLKKPYELAPLLYVSILGSSIIDIFVFHCSPDIWSFIGFCLIILGSYIQWRKLSVKTS